MPAGSQRDKKIQAETFTAYLPSSHTQSSKPKMESSSTDTATSIQRKKRQVRSNTLLRTPFLGIFKNYMNVLL